MTLHSSQLLTIATAACPFYNGTAHQPLCRLIGLTHIADAAVYGRVIMTLLSLGGKLCVQTLIGSLGSAATAKYSEPGPE